MASQNNYSYDFGQGSRPEFQQNARYDQVAEAPSVEMDRIPSFSNESTRSMTSGYSRTTDGSSPMTPTSYETTSAYYNSQSTSYSSYDTTNYEPEYTPQYLEPPVDSYSYQGTAMKQEERAEGSYYEQRPTPSSLGWPEDSPLSKLYKFVLKKNREPYLELLEDWTPTYETPVKVYLDRPSQPQKGVFPCQFPGGCSGQFTREADLNRHYKNVHASHDCKDTFACDYPKCDRSKAGKEFTRKDHSRDHYKDYHKEDVGHAKCTRNNGKDMHGKERRKARAAWWDERKIDLNWWRCPKCLMRIRVDEKGWECDACKLPCESDRIDAREQSAARQQKGQKSTTAYPQTHAEEAGYGLPVCMACNGYGYVDSQMGYWDVCPSKCAAGVAYQASTQNTDWDNL